MSQHRFKHGTFEVMTGWDRPLQYFFLTVEKKRKPGVFVYCNLNDPALLPTMGGMTLNQVMDKLTALGIEAPTNLHGELLADQAGNVGNRVVDYGNKPAPFGGGV